MSLLRSEAGLNCFIRSSAGLRLEAAEREEKERDARGVGSCPRSKAFARVGEPGGQSLAVGAVLRLCTIELVATIRMTRCDTSHSRSGRANSNETDLQYYFPPTKNYSSSLCEEQDTARRITRQYSPPLA
ncbi:hypothetical protein V6N13_034879 [Hibiscus sabdariffa]|uniref:Uncharacterized protein n=1 Tax=Hibiscus sabdariffa TaxID=183260 RepID=A0ABR2AFQ2_9ROSI